MLRTALAAVALSAVLLLTGCPPPQAPAAPAPAPTTTTAAPAPAAAGDGRLTAAEWCAEHGVPEAVCTRCDKTLVESFKAKKDWCVEHALPESQCIAYNPGVEAKWKAMAPQTAAR